MQNDSEDNKDLNNNQLPKNQQGFLSKVRNQILPASGLQARIAIVLSVIFTLKIFVYSTTRLVKDNLVVANLGGEVIPFIKIFVSVSTIFVGVLYLFAIIRLTRRQLFYIILGVFMGFFAAFGFLIYPQNQRFLLSDQTVASMLSWLSGNTGAFFRAAGFFKMFLISSALGLFLSITNFKPKNIVKKIGISNLIVFGLYSFLYMFSGPILVSRMYLPVLILKIWPYSLYYIFSEFWGGYALQLLFWNFAHQQVTSAKEGKSIYPFVVFIGQIGQIVAAKTISKFVTSGYMVEIVSLMTLVAGVIIAILHEYLFRHTKREQAVYRVTVKEKASFAQSIKAMATSPVVLLVSVLIVFYGLAVTIIENYWKTNLKNLASILYVNNAAGANIYFTKVQAHLFEMIGWASLVAAYASGIISNNTSWLVGALITPITLGLGSCFFFGLDLFVPYLKSIMEAKKILYFAMMSGFIVLVFLKATKYTIFDNSKELLIADLDPTIKSEAKVADALAGRAGKPAGSSILWFLTMIFNSLTILGVRIFIFTLIMLVAAIWIVIVYRLNDVQKQSHHSNNI